ncbi:RING finger protein (Zin) [Coleophoma crateriformis]|uniref:RING finger protein (Zin) n=1 Tax=Coleophoma crateriformis TaxID=565419 RepID=A0A3D8T0S5_9HELO|nr:RING finger protein (Zin) [Coleophoma crateriformis]
MVLSALLRPVSPKAQRRNSPPTPHNSASTDDADENAPASNPTRGSPDAQYPHCQADVPSADSVDPDLRELRDSLVALAAIFPDVQVEVFREMLCSFDRESRLAVVTEALLKNKMKWVRGRYRVASKDRGPQNMAQETPSPLELSGLVPVEEQFRTPEYKKAVKMVTYHEFKGLSRSTINGVLAEFNHSYTLARPTLVALSSKSWRFSISSLFMRRKPVSHAQAEDHPLVVWHSTGQGSIYPTIKATSSVELDRELFDSLIVPLQERMIVERETKDRELALQLNVTEAEEQDFLHDCECCFTATTFEELAACNDGGHLICFRCIRHAVNESLFGQGWQRNIDLESGTLRCVAAMSDDCHGCVPRDFVHRAFIEEKGGKDVLRKLDERLAEDNLLKTKLPLIRCPFCSYAEVDELYLPEAQRSWKLKRAGSASFYTLAIFTFGLGMVPFCLPLFMLFSVLFLFVSSRQTFGDYALSHIHSSVIRLRRKGLGLKFVCQSEHCRRASCISCQKAWTDIHICHESSLVALRTQVELAMSLAIKRTCPRCNTSFVKSSGCNKLTCVCGYQMCYVCRKDIGNGEGYRHFCEHFRPNGGRGCTECNKCDLYRCEDDEVVVKKAKMEAERAWMEKEGTALDADNALRKALEENWQHSSGSRTWWHLRMPNWQSLFDALVSGVLE